MQLMVMLMSPPSGSSGGSGGLFNILFLVGIFAVMYFFMIRPQAKKAKDQRSFLDQLQKGDKIVTVSGMHGRITRLNDNGTVEVEIDTNTKIIMERSGISLEFTRAVQQQSGQQPAK